MFAKRLSIMLSMLAIFVGSCARKKAQTDYQSANEAQKPASDIRVEGMKQEMGKETIEIVTWLKGHLSAKGKEFPFRAEYELAFLRQPRIAGSQTKRAFIAEKPTSFFAEERNESFVSTILIKQSQLFWQYSEETVGSFLFKGSPDLAGLSPEQWLYKQGFVHNSYTDLDQDLILLLEELLQKSKLLTKEKGDQLERYTFMSDDYGQFDVTLTTHQILLAGNGKTIFRYSYDKDLPAKGEDPVQQLLKRFSAKKGEDIIVMDGQITMSSVFEKAFGKGEFQNVSWKQCQEIAKKEGYLLPSKNLSSVRKMKTYFGSLTLDIEKGGKTYSIAQFRRASISFEAAEPFVARKRKAFGYTVQEVVHPGTKYKLIYYVIKEKGIMFLVDAPAEFEDKNLDAVIATFEPVKR